MSVIDRPLCLHVLPDVILDFRAGELCHGKTILG